MSEMGPVVYYLSHIPCNYLLVTSATVLFAIYYGCPASELQAYPHNASILQIDLLYYDSLESYWIKLEIFAT
jgi:hypothetical protein